MITAKQKRYSEKALEEMKALYWAGCPLYEIARLHKTQEDRVRSTLHYYGVKGRSRIVVVNYCKQFNLLTPQQKAAKTTKARQKRQGYKYPSKPEVCLNSKISKAELRQSAEEDRRIEIYFAACRYSPDGKTAQQIAVETGEPEEYTRKTLQDLVRRKLLNVSRDKYTQRAEQEQLFGMRRDKKTK